MDSPLARLERAILAALRRLRRAKTVLAAYAASVAVGMCAALLLFVEMGEPASALLFGGMLGWLLFSAATLAPRPARRRTLGHSEERIGRFRRSIMPIPSH